MTEGSWGENAGTPAVVHARTDCAAQPVGGHALGNAALRSEILVSKPAVTAIEEDFRNSYPSRAAGLRNCLRNAPTAARLVNVNHVSASSSFRRSTSRRSASAAVTRATCWPLGGPLDRRNTRGLRRSPSPKVSISDSGLSTRSRRAGNGAGAARRRRFEQSRFSHGLERVADRIHVRWSAPVVGSTPRVARSRPPVI